MRKRIEEEVGIDLPIYGELENLKTTVNPTQVSID